MRTPRSRAETPAPQSAAPRPSLRAALLADVERLRGPEPTLPMVLSALLTPPMLCASLYRLSHGCWERRWHALARGLSRLNTALHRAIIHPASRIGPGLYIPHTAGVVFCGAAGSGLTLYAHAQVFPRSLRAFRDDLDDAAAPSLGDGVLVGACTVVSGAVRIGHRAALGVGCVVDRDVPDDSVALARPPSGAGPQEELA